MKLTLGEGLYCSTPVYLNKIRIGTIVYRNGVYKVQNKLPGLNRVFVPDFTDESSAVAYFETQVKRIVNKYQGIPNE
ncbi:hypothetical protein [Providencia phage PSTCR7]|uniref:Uncharacterized protein n=1 Tax=Providencia phage PSTCR7 TaxID=2783549 RepID=A0A7S9SWK9_9CAUD|nr:hypothetical protein PQD10_gp55 [Providencia phage PSTCR7]QPI18507.1 hypothetical protein [Providencia phage PSTCR7]